MRFPCSLTTRYKTLGGTAMAAQPPKISHTTLMLEIL